MVFLKIQSLPTQTALVWPPAKQNPSATKCIEPYAMRVFICFWAMLSWAGLGISSLAQSPRARAPGSQAAPDLSQAVGELSQALAQPRRWRLAGRQRREMTQAVPALERNLAQAAPALLREYEKQPDNVAAAFRLYRDLQAVAQVADRVAGLAEHNSSQASARRLLQADRDLRAGLSGLGDMIERLALRQQAEITRLQTLAARPRPPRRLVIQNANRQADKPH